MRQRNRLTIGLLAGAWILGAGAAPIQGVRQADRWHREADLARTGGQWDIAYPLCMRLADSFPGMPHGLWGQERAFQMREQALDPDQSPAEESRDSWVREIRDFFTWP